MPAPATAGDLRFRVRFDKQVERDDPGGGTLTEWVPQFTRWADIRPLKGSETVQAQRLAGIQPALILVRFDSETRTIDPSWRAVEQNNGQNVAFYALKTASDMERERQFITMTAEIGSPDGGTA